MGALSGSGGLGGKLGRLLSLGGKTNGWETSGVLMLYAWMGGMLVYLSYGDQEGILEKQLDQTLQADPGAFCGRAMAKFADQHLGDHEWYRKLKDHVASHYSSGPFKADPRGRSDAN
ncbi:unnamed protein product [Pedinophyceae sp. YPF-701]|nr:unnamed protein product [Pedinophyceae sp. YPF-701]